MYAPAGRPNQTAAAAGMGFVDRYDENGVLQQRVVTGGPLAAPWASPSRHRTLAASVVISSLAISALSTARSTHSIRRPALSSAAS